MDEPENQLLPEGSAETDDALPADTEWYVAVSDSKGQSIPLQFRVTPQIYRILKQFILFGRFPYKDVSDLIRHGLVRHIHWLTSLGRAPKTTLGQVQLMQRLIEDEHTQQEFKHTLECAYAAWNNAKELGNEAAAQELLGRIRAAVEDMPEGSWKGFYQGELLRLFRGE